MRLLEREPPGRELADAYLLVAFDELIAGRATAALEWAGRTLELAERLDLGAERAIALELRGAARNQPGELAGLDDLREALRSTIELGLAPLTGRIANNLTEEQWPAGRGASGRAGDGRDGRRRHRAARADLDGDLAAGD